ncbi:MAG: hypothetical protein GF317_21095 [Candidatus Lokiarchaeota archaeon]|nr:hypothetical protein [Candidatus Lokiarchaeota archaeon]MBD3201942.1 hypothetical protein [Candidatus Lokiarchaeota archaeon]
MVRFLVELGVIDQSSYDQFQYIFDIILGILGFHILIDLKIFNFRQNTLWKAINFILGTNFITAVAFFIYYVPSIREYTVGYLFLLNSDVEFPIYLVLIVIKTYGIGGFALYLVQLCILLYKSNLYKKSTLILLYFSIISFYDAIVIIPVFEVLFEFGAEIVLAIWFITILFLIAARLNRISFKILMDIKEIIFIANSGIPLFALSNKDMDSELVGGALVGINLILQEISGSNKSKINSIDQGDNKLLFAFGDYCFVMLMSGQESQLLFSMIKTLLENFELQYKPSLKNFDGETTVFKSAKGLVDSVFSQVKWREAPEIK